ncbi:patatin-like phospholipase family protein [Streptomyces sp. NPDC059340]|uniref:patatin-like phospholipase family protein n=1 Tax=Streptomyces sp. NPDC059340 TaxID=3346806 RepID=UPI0036CDE738
MLGHDTSLTRSGQTRIPVDSRARAEMKNERALVLGGGGVAGVPWATGVLAGLADAGVDVTDADFLFGTSAGSVVTAQISSGMERPTLFQTRVDLAFQREELTPREGALDEVFECGAKEDAEVTDPVERPRRTGEMAPAPRPSPRPTGARSSRPGCRPTAGRSANCP